MKLALTSIATLILIAANSTVSFGQSCPSRYRDISFGNTLDFADKTSGVVTIKSGKELFKLSFYTTYSNGYSREYIELKGIKNSSSVMLWFNKDLSYGDENASKYLVIPDL